MADNDSDKEHSATGRQREKYAEEGDVARSRDLSAAVGFAGSVLVLVFFARGMVHQLAQGMQNVLRDVAQPPDARLFSNALALFWQATTPIFAASMVTAVGLGFWQSGWTINFRPIKFQFTLAEFFPRLGKLFQLKESGLNLLVQAVKMIILGWVCGAVMLQKIPVMVQHVPASVGDGYLLAADLLMTLTKRAVVTYLILGAFDYGLNLYRLEQRMKMSTQEIRDETKDINGDGRLKGRMRAMHAKIIQQRSMQEVPKADVVLVNPTHYAVAILYNDKTMEAPTVVAKGADLWAERIRALARSHSVPVISQPALARALFARVDTGRPIPHELYQAVALVLAHVYRVRKRNH